MPNVPNVPRPNGALALVNWPTWGQASAGCARYARCVEGSCAHGNWRQHMTRHNVRLASHPATGHALGPGICCGTSVAAGQNAHRGYGYMIHHWETREHPETISHNAEHKIAQVHTSSMCFQYASMFAYFWYFYTSMPIHVIRLQLLGYESGKSTRRSWRALRHSGQQAPNAARKWQKRLKKYVLDWHPSGSWWTLVAQLDWHL